MSDSVKSSKQSPSQRFFLNLWFRSSKLDLFISYLLLPLTWLFRLIATIRAAYLKRQPLALAVPVLVVGNITVGGTGKTPFVIALVKELKEQGIKVGVISRGYGSAAPAYPFSVVPTTSSKHGGDEAVLLAQEAQCPVVIDSNRVAAAQYLLQIQPDTQLIVSDDGLQHYALSRQMEVILLDGQRGLGNGFCLPSGPLREPPKRLASASWVFSNGQLEDNRLKKTILAMSKDSCSTQFEELTLLPNSWRHILSNKSFNLHPFPWLLGDNTQTDTIDKSITQLNENINDNDQLAEASSITAIAAIGHPERFFTTLKEIGVGLGDEQSDVTVNKSISTLAYDDHHQFSFDDFVSLQDSTVLMTSKDAVKCQNFAKQHWWVLEVSMKLPKAFLNDVFNLIHTN